MVALLRQQNCDRWVCSCQVNFRGILQASFYVGLKRGYLAVLWGIYPRINRTCAIDLSHGAWQRQDINTEHRTFHRIVFQDHKAWDLYCRIPLGRTFLSGAFYTPLCLSTRRGRIRGFSMLVTYAFAFFMYFGWPNCHCTLDCSAMGAVWVCACEFKEWNGIQEGVSLSIQLLVRQHRYHTFCIGLCRSWLFRLLDTACGCRASP